MFTPLETSIGAVLLHWATTTLLYNNGSILGASGLLRGLLSAPSRSNLLFFGGMALSPLLLKLFLPELMPLYPVIEWGWKAAAFTVGTGFLTGWGTKNCNGCTSGHMLCGLSRLSGRSLIAVGAFFPTAMITYQLSQWLSAAAPLCESPSGCFVPVFPSQATAIRLVSLASGSILATYLCPHVLNHITEKQSAARLSTSFLSGLTFGLGLLISGMASPSKILSFFALSPFSAAHWDPSLSLVIVFGILPNLLRNHLEGWFQKPPCFSDCYKLPTKTVKDIDKRFVLGAVVFGISWGLSGACPGPATLRTLLQPVWGSLWMGGFYLGGLLASL